MMPLEKTRASHTLIYEVEPMPTQRQARLEEWLTGAPLELLRDCPQVLSVDLFRPHRQWNEVVRFDDGPPPSLIVEIGCRDRGDIDDLTSDASFRDTFGTLPEAAAASLGAYSIVRFPVAGETEAAPRAAAMSFVVRYFGPTPDVAAFGAAYIAAHPRLLGRFAGIRNVICYRPVPWRHYGLPLDPTIFRNEVVFDDVEALNAALQSDVMAELAADTAGFPAFGFNTHHAMERTTLI